jgi:putative phosphoribosyl transferase
MPKAIIFRDREDAGQRLAKELARFKDHQPAILALPRGGVPVGFEVARALTAPLDVILVRKLGSPITPELAIGAIAEGDGVEPVIDEQIVAQLDVEKNYIDAEIARQKREITRRQQLYAGARPTLDLHAATAIVIDDGIATGATMQAALRAARKREPKTLILAVPVAPEETIERLRRDVDEVVCLSTPLNFGAVGSFYADFSPVEDEVVVALLKRATALRLSADTAAPMQKTVANTGKAMI